MVFIKGVKSVILSLLGGYGVRPLIGLFYETHAMSRTAVAITLEVSERELLQKIHNKRSVPEFLKRRVQVVLAAATGIPNKAVAAQYDLEVHFVGQWRNRFASQYRFWKQTDETLRPVWNEKLVLRWLRDAQGRGRKDGFPPEKRTKIAAISLESPEQSGLPVTHWTPELLAAEAVRRGIVVTISPSTGIQALERISPTKPMESGKVERIEYEYKRHGTTCLFGNWDVGRGGIVSPLLNPTRTEEDYAKNIDGIIATDPDKGWVFVCDDLNTHVSESLVLSVAKMLGIGRENPGRKGKDGTLKSMASRKAFLEDESHRIRFVFTPKHCSWLNQIETWFSGLSRRVLRRGSFDSVEILIAKILNYIEFYNRTAKPMNWKYYGLPPKTFNEDHL